MQTRRQLTRLGIATVAAAATLAAVPAGAATLSGTSSSAPYCGIWWGSLPEHTSTGYSSGHLENVRSGRHTCFDRLVLDVDDATRGLKYDVRYVSTVRQDGSGTAVPLRGAADIRIIARVPSYDSSGHATYRPADYEELVDTSGYSTFRQVAFAGSFEGQTTIGLGVRARLPMRAFTLVGPGDNTRLVIDVAHRW